MAKCPAFSGVVRERRSNSVSSFVGSIRKKYTLVAQYAGFLKSFLILAIIIGAINIVFLWIDYKDRTGSCASDDSSCSTLVFIMASVFVVLPTLLQTYAVYIVSAYAHKLVHDEKLQLPHMSYAKVADIDAPKTSLLLLQKDIFPDFKSVELYSDLVPNAQSSP
ncbi:hypothetical protein DL96DRAFT_1568338 [Flagelloscypha sp. PMI_526]|nr:hypothetical protein DL96DRAFT_1568338 [Flagelloscypha sp. PMI_526]